MKIKEIKTKVIACVSELKEQRTITTDYSKFHNDCDSCISLLSKNIDNLTEQGQLNTFKRFFDNYEKEDNLASKTNYQRLEKLIRDWENELEKKTLSWEEDQKNWFQEKIWLTDFEIDWAIEQIKQEYSITSESTYKFLEAYIFMYVKEIKKAKEKESKEHMPFYSLLNEFTNFQGELIFIPVNNPNYHWSLLVYEQSTKTFYHYDSLEGCPNHDYIKPLVAMLIKRIHQKSETDLANKHLWIKNQFKQTNTYDCGIAVIAIIKRIIEKWNSDIKNKHLEQIDLGKFDFLQERKEWREKWKNK